MIRIGKATKKDIELIIEIGKNTFLEAHGKSASAEDLTTYLNQSYHQNTLSKELEDPKNLFHIIYFNNEPAGFSKIIINGENANPLLNKVTKLERIYIYKIFYDKRLGLTLLNFNIYLSKKLSQKGMWLYVWVENQRAINFYKKMGFEIIGAYNFKISATKSNPNHQMLLRY